MFGRSVEFEINAVVLCVTRVHGMLAECSLFCEAVSGWEIDRGVQSIKWQGVKTCITVLVPPGAIRFPGFCQCNLRAQWFVTIVDMAEHRIQWRASVRYFSVSLFFFGFHSLLLFSHRRSVIRDNNRNRSISVQLY